MVSSVTKESLAARIADLESGARSLKEDYTLAAYKMLLATMEAEPMAYIFKHPSGRLFWSLTDESNKDQNDVMPVYASPQPPVAQPPVAHELDEREAFEAFMEGRFGDTVDRRRAKNGDQGYMAWDMVVAWVAWKARARKQK